MRNTTLSLLLAGLLLVPGASFADKKDKGADGKVDANHQDTFVPGSAGEARLAQEVRHQLAMLPYYSIFDDLGFRVQDSTITLVGEVVRPTLKSDAEGVVKRVEGVSKVVNNIEVLPLSPMDNQIRFAVARSIYGDPSIGDRYGYRALPSIHIIVKNGHVTLEGVVANQGDKNLINIRANTVPNVFSVDNRLQVENSKS